mgnify:CR=1 FL=1
MNTLRLFWSIAVLALSTHASLAQTEDVPKPGAWDAQTSQSGGSTSQSSAKAASKDAVVPAKTKAANPPVKAVHTAPSQVPVTAAAAVPTATAAAVAPTATALPAAAIATVPQAAAPLETGALPAAPVRQATQSGDWLLECAPGGVKPECSLRQLVVDAKKRRITELRATTAGQTAFLEVTVPVGISIPYGVSVDVASGTKLSAQLVDCNQTGCRAVLPLDQANVAALKSAKVLAVTFQDSKSGKVISISGSPKGFDVAIGKVIDGG